MLKMTSTLRVRLKMDKQCLVTIWIISLVIGLARGNICPADRVYTSHDVTSATTGEVTIQRGIFQQIPCTTFRPGESIAAVVWYQGNSNDDPERVRLIGSSDEGDENQKYKLTSNNGLIIKDVQKRDEGSYVCIVVPYASINRHIVVDVHVIEDEFPAVKADITTTSSLSDSTRHRISCPCDTGPSSALYWSQGTGVTRGTDILCARFPAGTVLQFKRGDDLGVADDGSLILNSLQNFTGETARFWCHVFKPDGSLMNCYVDAEIVNDEQPSNNALQSSQASFYTLKGKHQTLPCRNGPISGQTCEVQWFKGVSSNAELLLNYTAWNDVTYDDESFDLGSDFALAIKSVDEDNGGVYNCRKNSESQLIEVRVIGDTFPLDNGNITRFDRKTFEAQQTLNYTLDCMTGLEDTKSRTGFWSYGQKDAINTTVIGMFKLSASSANVEGLKSNSCYSIIVDGALQLTGCFIDSDIRYWCHVFLDGQLYRYYVDLVAQDSSKSFSGIVAIIIPFIAVVIIMCVLGVVCWKCRLQPCKRRQQNDYAMVDVEDHLSDPRQARLIEEVKEEVLKRVGRVSITPWATEDKSCYAPIEDVFTPLELFINHNTTNRIIRYQLESAAQIFDDGIPQLKSKHVVLEGKAGSGKTTLLHKLAFDTYKGRPDALLGQVRVVFVFTAELLLRCDNLGKAVFQQLLKHTQLPKHTQISSRSINSFCKSHSKDVAILVDDCDDVGQVIKVISKQGLLGAYVVMTIRQWRSEHSSEFRFRHVTVSGFTPTNARRYIQSILKDSKKSADLIRYLDEHILPPDVESLPSNLTALCQLSLWTNGEVFRHQVGHTTCELFCKVVKCLLEGAAYETAPQGEKLGRSGSGKTIEGHQLTQDQQTDGSGQIMEDHQLTQDQQEILVTFGKIVLQRVSENPGTLYELSRTDFDQFDENKNNAFDEGVRVGLLRVRVGGSASQTEHTAYFVLEILQDLCAGISLTRTQESLSYWLKKMMPLCTRFAKVLIFADLSGYSAYPAIMKETTRRQTYITSKLKSLNPVFGTSKDPRERSRILKLTQTQMQMIEMCLQLGHESRGGVDVLTQMVSSMFQDGKIRLIGVSGQKLRLLSYFLKHVKTDSFMRSKIKSIKLLRLGNHPSKELRKYLEYFLRYVFEDTDKETSELEASDSENLTLRALLERVESTLRGEVDMRSTCHFDFDTSVILAMQSSFLQDTTLSQSGECFMSTPAKDFAQCLLHLKDLEKIVLIGSILSSETICELAKNLGKLPQLKWFDLRLNKQIDDAAFIEVTRSVSSCKSLVDLRLSLYKVTLKGFDEVQQYIGDKEAWRRLKILFLLHGSPTEKFVTFLSNIMKYLKNVEEFNISALSSSGYLSDGATNGFENAIKSMKSQTKIEIENMDILRTRIKPVKTKKNGSSKDQKQKNSSNDLPKESEICGVSEKSPVTKAGVENIPEQPENIIDEIETTPPEAWVLV